MCSGHWCCPLHVRMGSQIIILNTTLLAVGLLPKAGSYVQPYLPFGRFSENYTSCHRAIILWKNQIICIRYHSLVSYLYQEQILCQNIDFKYSYWSHKLSKIGVFTWAIIGDLCKITPISAAKMSLKSCFKRKFWSGFWSNRCKTIFLLWDTKTFGKNVSSVSVISHSWFCRKSV